MAHYDILENNVHIFRNCRGLRDKKEQKIDPSHILCKMEDSRVAVYLRNVYLIEVRSLRQDISLSREIEIQASKMSFNFLALIIYEPFALPLSRLS